MPHASGAGGSGSSVARSHRALSKMRAMLAAAWLTRTVHSQTTQCACAQEGWTNFGSTLLQYSLPWACTSYLAGVCPNAPENSALAGFCSLLESAPTTAATTTALKPTTWEWT
eukprot:1461999-Prymnesium_polylepis.2